MKILLIDDHPFTRDGMRLALHELDDTLDVLESAGLAEAYLILQAQPDIRLILLDLELEVTAGIATLHALSSWLAAHGIEPRIVVISGSHQQPLVESALNGSATGYILKGTSREALVVALATTLAGGVHVPELTPSQRASDPAARERDRIAQNVKLLAELTPREREVAALLVEGLTYRSIATRLEPRDGRQPSEHTVREHVNSMAWKLGVTGNVKSGVLLAIAKKGWTFA